MRRVSTLKTPTGPVGVFPFSTSPSRTCSRREARIVLLHGVQDPGNVGTVIRSAHAFGAGVALSRGCADLYNPKTVRATMGSIFHAPVVRELETVEFLGRAAGAGFAHGGGRPRGGRGAFRGVRPEKLVVVVGAEGSGLPPEVVEACDARVTVPSRAASLNAAVAASILLYEAHMRMLG